MAMALMLSLFAGAAFAAVKIGNAEPNRLVGTGNNDVLRGLGGNDKLYGRGDGDRLYGGAGRDLLVGGDDHDLLVGGAGRDLILARDGDTDRINCGAGRDTVRADRDDRVAKNSENVRKSRTPQRTVPMLPTALTITATTVPAINKQ
ncbi:MAG TPA: hypothetical protein VFE21_06375 [Rubrobacteraceae bacterium]|nr:hypothetical protein [Rubrobacteraceae bacterium]